MEKQRNYGIDLLKIIAMLMIVIIHTQGHGGILFSGILPYTQETFFYSNYAASLLIESFIFPAVNCYALITGYVNWNRKIRYYKLAIFWIQILFYMISIASIYSIVEASFDQTIWFNAFFPIMSYQYWYMTAYVGVFLLMPILNAYIQNTEKKALLWHLLLLFIFMSVLPLFFSHQGDPFIFNSGYSTFWLVLMYLAGGVISKCDLGLYISKAQSFIYYIFITVFSWGYKIIIDYLNTFAQANITVLNIFDYRTPTCILSAIFLLFLFKKIKVNKFIVQRIISLLSSTTLGVYLIHEHPIVRYNIIRDYARDFVNFPTYKMVMYILLGSITIYITCTVIDFFRLQLFRFIKIEKSLKTIELKLSSLFLR